MAAIAMRMGILQEEKKIHLGVTSAVNFCLTKRFAIHLQGRKPCGCSVAQLWK